MVVSCKESANKRRSTIKNGRLTHTFVFVVICDNPHDGTAAAVLAPGLPRYGETLNGDINTVVSSIEANPINGSTKHFEVLVEYDSAGFESTDLHPLDRPPEYSFGGESFTEGYFLDESQPTKKPFVNTAQDAFETLWERKKTDLTINITRNVQFWTTLDADDFNDSTNSDIIYIDGTGYAADVLCMGAITAVKTREMYQGESVEFYRETLPIGVRKAGWLDHPEDRGFNTIKQITKSVSGVDTLVLVKQPILDATGQKITKPWLTGVDVSGQRYSFVRVFPDASSDSPDLILDSGMKFRLYDNDPAHVWQAREVNDTRGIPSGTIVRMSFAGYDGQGTPQPMFIFQYIAVPLEPDFVPIHDHRDNFAGGFAFGVYHPGTALPQQRWSA